MYLLKFYKIKIFKIRYIRYINKNEQIKIIITKYFHFIFIHNKISNNFKYHFTLNINISHYF